MIGYFIIVSEKDTMKRVETIDVSEYRSALDIAKDKFEEGYAVSVWRGTRIYVSSN